MLFSKKPFQIWGTREAHLNMVYYWPVGQVRELPKFLGKGYTHAFVYSEGETLTWCEDFQDLRTIGQFLLRKFLKNEKELSRIVREWRQATDKFLNRAKELYQTDFRKKSNQELLKIYQEVVRFNKKSSWGYFTDVMQMFLQEEVKKRLAKYPAEDEPNFNSYYASLTASVNLSLVSQEEISLLRIVRKVVSSPNLQNIFQKPIAKILLTLQKYSQIDRVITGHTDKYFWLGGNYTGRGFFDKKYFLGKIKEELGKTAEEIDQEIKRIQDLPEKARKEKERVIKILKLDQEFLKVIKILEKIVVFHDQRKKTILAPVFYLMPLEAEIAKRFQIKRDELVWLTPQEIIRALKTGKIDLNKIKKRSLKCAFYCDAKKEIIATGKEADGLIERWLAKPEERGIKGTVANPGKIQGVVKVVKSIKEIFKIQKGDILVCGMTTPDYVPALKKASAVITDEGGITCHAAIVSRELGIPCIIGTKIATQVLKDGDVIEVDANHGRVKILRG